VDRDVFERIVLAHQAGIYRYLRYLGASESVAEDVLQDTFIVLMRNPTAHTMEPNVRLAAWLRGVARNKFLTHCRRQKRRKPLEDGTLMNKAELVWRREFLRQSDGFDYMDALRRCVDALPEKQRLAIEMRYDRRESRSGMARLLGMTENGVKSLLRRVRAALGDCVRRRIASEEGAE
jgi:RNA polymerase sigma-70 factor, ECF subfamily